MKPDKWDLFDEAYDEFIRTHTYIENNVNTQAVFKTGFFAGWDMREELLLMKALEDLSTD